MPIYHFLYYGHEKTVIDSQVITPARLLAQDNLAVRLKYMERWNRVPRNFLWLNTLHLFFTLLPAMFVRENVVVHARGLQGAAVVLPLKKIFKKLRVVCDVRGHEAEEYAYNATDGGKRPLSAFARTWKNHLEKLMERVIRRSDRVFFVSRAMMEHLDGRDNRWIYIPCAVQVDKFAQALARRDALRRELGLENRVVVTYAGGNRLWQGTEQIAALYKKMKALEPKLAFLGLTHEQDALRAAFKAQGIADQELFVRPVPYEKIQDYLVCADMGLLIRENIPLNNYACPTKFAEYLASGLHVITTPAIFDIVRVIAEEGVGTIIQTDNDLKTALAQSANVAARMERSVQAARKCFDWAVYLPKIKQTYRELL